jgi:DNA repair exonuclease SbcCD ATPase subunit
VRESELQQLTAHILEDRAGLPDAFNTALDRSQMEVEREFDAELKRLTEERASLLKKAEQARQASIKGEQAARKKNVGLDQKEEELKARNEALLAEIARFNEEIRGLGRGFGFFANLFKMRELSRRRRTLDQEQADAAARIEGIRWRWAEAAKEHTARENELRQQWVDLETEVGALQTKLDYLKEARPRVILRSTVERVLFDLSKEPPGAKEGDPPCPRCKTPNPAEGHFCRICAQRLTEDRPDFEGSIQEIAELNLHHRRFSEGMQACQQIIGLVRGLKSGLAAFKESVVDMLSSQREHKLAVLQLEVPQSSVTYGQHLDALKEAVDRDLSLHPKVMARHVEQLVAEVFTEEQIKAFFETMGEELSRQADLQW